MKGKEAIKKFNELKEDLRKDVDGYYDQIKDSVGKMDVDIIINQVKNARELEQKRVNKFIDDVRKI